MRLSPLVFSLCVAVSAFGQQTVLSSPGAKSFPLDVVVTDRKGAPVSGLAQTDFVVHVDKQTAAVNGFRAVTASGPGAEPVETILLIDAVNTRPTNVAYERNQIDHFLKSNGGRLAQPTTVVIMTDTKTQILPTTTRDGVALASALDQTDVGLREFYGRQGFYSWVEQFQISAHALQEIAAYEQTRPGRKLLLWISPGWPLLSGPEVQLDRKQEDAFFASLVSLTQEMRKARITLSSIDPLGTADAVSYRTIFYKQFTKPVPDARHIQIGNLALQVLATQSGGRVLNSSNDTSALIAEAASDANAFYTLDIPIPPAKSPEGFHTITVQVEKDGLQARARTVLYTVPADPPAGTPTVPPPSR